MKNRWSWLTRAKNSLRAWTCILLGLVFSGPAQAELRPKFSALFSREVWLVPEVGQHGAIFAFVDLEGLPADSHFEAGWNLDTLQIGWDRIRLLSRGDWIFETGFLLKAELAFAGVYPDFYRRGKKEEGRGFLANYALGRAHLKATMGRHNFFELAFVLRRWFFWRGDGGLFGQTDPQLVLPPEAWVFEPRFHYTFWKVGADRSTWERQRLFPRITGFAFGTTLGFDARSETFAWGLARAGNSTDPRNRPQPLTPHASVWARAGWQPRTAVRTQGAFWWSWTRGADDLNRVRVGAMSPYAIPLPGLPWGALWSDRVLAVEWSWHFGVWREVELGVLADLVVLNDPERRDERHRDQTHLGISLFADLRFGAWQIDLRGGWAPTVTWQTDAGHWSVLAAVGWATGG